MDGHSSIVVTPRREQVVDDRGVREPRVRAAQLGGGRSLSSVSPRTWAS